MQTNNLTFFIYLEKVTFQISNNPSLVTILENHSINLQKRILIKFQTIPRLITEIFLFLIINTN